jgi:hypothetical protein
MDQLIEPVRSRSTMAVRFAFMWSWRECVRIPLLGAILASSLPVLTGCGESDRIPRYDLSGDITYDGKPVPGGYISFRPDGKKGNRGPGASAVITDGRYETGSGEGTVGGPHIAVIHGTDGVPYNTEDGYHIPVGRPLFPKYTMRIDLPKDKATTHVLKVPAK